MKLKLCSIRSSCNCVMFFFSVYSHRRPCASRLINGLIFQNPQDLQVNQLPLNLTAIKRIFELRKKLKSYPNNDEAELKPPTLYLSILVAH